MSLLPRIIPRSDTQKLDEIKAKYLRMEAKIGGELFGPLPKGHSRQFFCLDVYTWIWYETWKDTQGKQHTVTTRYSVQSNDVLKSQDGQTYQRLTEDEARNLYKAVDMYQQRVGEAYQRILQTA